MDYWEKICYRNGFKRVFLGTCLKVMDDRDLICNFKKCRKIVTNYAYVTACSTDVFCDEDGGREFKKALACPACNMELPSKFDIVRNNLQPSEQYKSMILAGLKPEIIIEICSRAISFWLYQCHQEKRYHEFTANKAKDRLTQLEQYYEQIVSRTTSELQSMKIQLDEAKKEHEDTKRKYSEICDNLAAKNNQHQKLQTLYDRLRKKFIAMSNYEESQHSVRDDHQSHPANYKPDDKIQLTPFTGTNNNNEPANHALTKFDIGLGTPRQ